MPTYYYKPEFYYVELEGVKTVPSMVYSGPVKIVQAEEIVVIDVDDANGGNAEAGGNANREQAKRKAVTVATTGHKKKAKKALFEELDDEQLLQRLRAEKRKYPFVKWDREDVAIKSKEFKGNYNGKVTNAKAGNFLYETRENTVGRLMYLETYESEPDGCALCVQFESKHDVFVNPNHLRVIPEEYQAQLDAMLPVDNCKE